LLGALAIRQLGLPCAEHSQEVFLRLRRNELLLKSAESTNRSPHLVHVDSASFAEGQMLIETQSVGRKEGSFEVFREQLNELFAAHFLILSCHGIG